MFWHYEYFFTTFADALIISLSLKNSDKIIKAINSGDIAAYKSLYDLHYATLVTYANSILADNEGAGEDIVQDVIVNIWEAKTQFSSYSSFKTYLYNAVRNSALNHIKHQGAADKYIEYLRYEYARFDEQEVNIEEIYRQLFLLIDHLPYRCREVFLLHMEGHKNEEIARILQLSVETVKTQKKRALAYIRANLDKSLIYE